MESISGISDEASQSEDSEHGTSCHPLITDTINTGQIPAEVRQAAVCHCQRLLDGAWWRLTADSIRMTSLGDGVALSNYIYLCELPDHIPVEGFEPRQALVRFYGEVIKEDIQGVIQNSVIFSILAGLKLGPQLYGLFDGGRIEEYLPSRCVRESEMRLPSISKRVAKRLAQFHNLTMPICKPPFWFYECIEKWLPVVPQLLTSGSGNSFHAEHLRRLGEMDLGTEYADVKELARSVRSPVVFCHNDLNRGNILLLDNSEELVFIDLDFCSYNHRGFDIASYFNEWCDYQKMKKFPECLSTYPSREQQLEFYRTYLTASGIDLGDIEDEAESMIREVRVWGTLAHYFYALWALNTVGKCNIDFPFIEWAVCRLETYFKWKAELG
ncbi:choline/ethanolamine kinase-like [Lingula anatina]|uniref:Choline/ethanolamine kinase-like n=1 Tax=Lingula anatina TaxID=7574 RepID=A0A1S3JYP8_LINAN|nr:choline/ethanolamine kinase-like [Lingula anatina]|eukprot:XP_013415417.1 choline/ethanolamine kinase-like [Lingula anatina]